MFNFIITTVYVADVLLLHALLLNWESAQHGNIIMLPQFSRHEPKNIMRSDFIKIGYYNGVQAWILYWMLT